jgi:hypothetical protein
VRNSAAGCLSYPVLSLPLLALLLCSGPATQLGIDMAVHLRRNNQHPVRLPHVRYELGRKGFLDLDIVHIRATIQVYGCFAGTASIAYAELLRLQSLQLSLQTVAVQSNTSVSGVSGSQDAVVAFIAHKGNNQTGQQQQGLAGGHLMGVGAPSDVTVNGLLCTPLPPPSATPPSTQQPGATRAAMATPLLGTNYPKASH